VLDIWKGFGIADAGNVATARRRKERGAPEITEMPALVDDLILVVWIELLTVPATSHNLDALI
jgi:hypothetical protein